MKHLSFDKSKQALTRQIFLMFLLLSIIISSPLIQASSISILHKEYVFISSETIGINTFETFTIHITLKNNEQIETEEITITIIDQDELPIHRYVTFSSEETKTISFVDHVISGTGEHLVNITIYPTNEPDTIILRDSMILSRPGFVNNESDGTPGFTFPFLIMIIVALLVKQNHRKNMK